uniref:Uncharacterized protein n=1 Tax=Octopus bimaculoides TaxID=37653 RepID=A0A0L8GNR1_OCTBM
MAKTLNSTFLSLPSCRTPAESSAENCNRQEADISPLLTATEPSNNRPFEPIKIWQNTYKICIQNICSRRRSQGDPSVITEETQCM